MTTKQKELKVPTWLDTIHKNTKLLMELSYELKVLGISFYNTGNTIVGDRLVIISDELINAQRDIGRATGESLSERLGIAQKNTATILKTTLVGIKLGKDIN